MNKRDFYDCKAWRKLSKVFLQSKYYICEICGKPAEIAHHKTKITPHNIDNPDITLNIDNLQAVCLDCHNKIHFTHSRELVEGGSTRSKLYFDVNGELQEKKQSV